MRKRLLSVLAVLALLGLMLYVGVRERNVMAAEAPQLHVFDEEGNELPVQMLSEAEVEAMFNAPTVSISVEDLDYYAASGDSLLEYAQFSVPDFRHELVKTAQGAEELGDDEFRMFDEPYLEGPTISMEHFADMIDYYEDRNESVALLVYYTWDPFGGEAYYRKFKAYASSFERADVLEYWGELDWEYGGPSEGVKEVTLSEAIELIPAGRYDHLLIAANINALANDEQLAQQLATRSDFGEVVIFTYGAASLRSCPEVATILTEKFSVVPILRPLMAWEDQSSE